jgi:hypothetical protein
MMTCEEFLEGYSDFRDSEEGDPTRVSFLLHVERCGSCARYDAVLRRGVALLQKGPELRLRSDFQDRLRHRIYQEDLEALRRRTPGASGGFSTLGWAVAALLGALALWEFLAPPPSLILPSVQARAPLSAPAVESRYEARPAVGGGAALGFFPEDLWAPSHSPRHDAAPLAQRMRREGDWIRVGLP